MLNDSSNEKALLVHRSFNGGLTPHLIVLLGQDFKHSVHKIQYLFVSFPPGYKNIGQPYPPPSASLPFRHHFPLHCRQTCDDFERISKPANKPCNPMKPLIGHIYLQKDLLSNIKPIPTSSTTNTTIK